MCFWDAPEHVSDAPPTASLTGGTLGGPETERPCLTPTLA